MGAKRGRVCRRRLQGGSVCRGVPRVIFCLLPTWSGRSTCSCGQFNNLKKCKQYFCHVLFLATFEVKGYETVFMFLGSHVLSQCLKPVFI